MSRVTEPNEIFSQRPGEPVLLVCGRCGCGHAGRFCPVCRVEAMLAHAMTLAATATPDVDDETVN
jgi:hypothetical protein